MSTQSKIEMALCLWVNDEMEMFRKTIRAEIPNILNYSGRGYVWDYFVPALLLENFWSELQDAGFPMEKIVYEKPLLLGWLAWDKAVNYMREIDPAFLKKAKELDGEQFEPIDSEENFEIMLDYYNTELSLRMQYAIEAYYDMSDDDWEKLLAKI